MPAILSRPTPFAKFKIGARVCDPQRLAMATVLRVTDPPSAKLRHCRWQPSVAHRRITLLFSCREHGIQNPPTSIRGVVSLGGHRDAGAGEHGAERTDRRAGGAGLLV